MRRRYWFVLVIVTLCVIFIMSSLDGENSSRFVDFVASFFGLKGSTVIADIEGFSFRKLGHVTEFALLGLVVMGWSKKPLFSIIFCYACACLDELHQAFVASRYCTLTDTFIDAVGFVSVILIWTLVRELSRSEA